jgi:alkylation response protein AidB-like acyl-CoA dehydrogenase
VATAARLVAEYRARRDQVPAALGDAVARAWADAEAYRLNTYWTVSHVLAGHAVGAEASLNKLFWSQMDLRMHEVALEMLGAAAELMPDDPGARRWLDGFLFSLAGPIYAGTNEIQRTIVAERVLGLPRSR